MNALKLVKIVFFRIVLVFVIVLLVTILPFVYFSVKNSLAGNQNIHRQILEIWNIDTFEGGSGSKSSFLSNMAIDFEKQNRGTYFMVKNMTQEECLLALEQGHMPAIFSYGTRFGNNIKNYIKQIDKNVKIKEEILETGKIDSNLFAVGWCASKYVYISSSEVVGSSAISEIALSKGSSMTNKKGKEKITYSLAFGEIVNKPTMTFADGINIPQYAYDSDNINKTAYQAYCDFVEGKAKILLGTIRDMLRIENRVSLGKFESSVYEPVCSFSDMVQYFSISSAAENEKMCMKFIEFVTSRNCQQKLKNISMLPCLEAMEIYQDAAMSKIEQAQVERYQKVFN